MRVEVNEIVILLLFSIDINGKFLLPIDCCLRLVVIGFDLLPKLLKIKTFHMGTTIRSNRIDNLLSGSDIDKVNNLIVDVVDSF